jgi:hypothetical protein
VTTAQVHSGLSRHASCHEVTADMASGHDAPDAAPTQSNTSKTLGETCSDSFCWWRLGCEPGHDTARKSQHESALHTTILGVPLPPLTTADFYFFGKCVAFVRVRLGLFRITNGTIDGSKGRFGQLCIADRHHENRDSLKCQAMCAILQLQHLARSALAQARTTALTPLQRLSSKAASQAYQEP